MNPLEITLVILLVTIIAFVSGKVPFSVISTGIILALILTGIKTPAEAFGGFINTNVVMFVAMFVIGAGLTLHSPSRTSSSLFLGQDFVSLVLSLNATPPLSQSNSGGGARSSATLSLATAVRTQRMCRLRSTSRIRSPKRWQLG